MLFGVLVMPGCTLHICISRRYPFRLLSICV
nr:hypothetical protein [Cyclovirus sp.]